MGVEKRALVVHLWTLGQKVFMPLRALELGVRRSAPQVSMGRRRPWATRWQRKGLTCGLREDRRWRKEKAAWPS